ncbi:LytTR family DNA-binding domain-containing protein [Blautia coccoides]|uniref:LytR/AlgR family response regulator transcription factor n=1 Tax=Blautia producta TaxID=33035 RepID=UPI0021499C28|nr:LytTR family DNA-binding domain-containing protein [Blautia coccoides]MCR1985087.1 LytTR family DNA-binding domain-containing protein [Blautia coccoides]
MIKIAVCDDERFYRLRIKKLITKYFGKKDILCEIDTYSSGSDLVKAALDIPKYNIIFLDINMEGMDGIQTAQAIRKISEEVYLVFITAFITYAIEGYKYNVVRYLVKDNNKFQELLEECLDAILSKMNFKVETRVFEFIEGKKSVNIEKILYIESDLHKIVFWIIADKICQYSLYGKLNTFEESLKSLGFIRIHQSYLVNIRYVETIKNYKATLVTGDTLPMSKSKYKFARDIFIEYKGEL